MKEAIKNSDFKWILLNIALFLIAALAAYVFHKIFTRIKEYYKIKTKTNLWIPSIIIGLSVLPFTLPFCVVVIHYLVIILVFNLIAIILRKTTGKEFKFLYSGIPALIVATVVSLYGIINFLVVNPHVYIVESDKVKTEHTIVYISDIHGPLMPDFLFEKYMKDISDLNADMVILGGDITDEFTSKEHMKRTYKTIGEIKTEDGIYFIYGNHDRDKYADKIKYSKLELDDTILNNGIKIMQDSVYRVDDELTLICREDGGSEGKDRKSIESLLTNVDPKTFVIVAEHEPDAYKEVAINPVDLYLCGHTHAGQMVPIGMYYRIFKHTFSTGRHKYKDLDVIITSGFGTWAFPFRTEYHSEYMVVKIVPKK